MLVCPARKFLVILPARCGTTSVKEAIKARFRCREYGPNHGVNIQPDQRSFYKVCLTRNPYTRVISIWKHWLGRSPAKTYKSGLDRFVHQHITVPQISFVDIIRQAGTRQAVLEVCPPISKLTRALKIDLWVAQERLAEEIQQLPFLDEKPLHLPLHHQSTYDQGWRAFYTPQLQEQVYQLYKDDFDVFGYPRELPE